MAIGCPVRYVHFTAPSGDNPYEEWEYTIPDGCTMDRPCSTDHPLAKDVRIFEGCSPGYMDLSVLSYCMARDAAIDLAEGIGLIIPDSDSDCQSDQGGWDGG